MNLFNKKIEPIQLIILVLLAISISMIDFSNMSWENNIKPYGGFAIAVILLVYLLITKAKKNQ